MQVPLTTRSIVDAIVYAAENNSRSMACETNFARKVKSNPSVIEARLRRIQYVCSLLGIGQGDVLLDVGAGIGINSALALLCGVKEVHAVEYETTRFESARLITEFLGVENRIHLHQADVLELDLDPESIDAAFSFELLEHISDTARLYGNLARWIRGGHCVYARTGANGYNLVNRRFFRKEWDRIDATNYALIRERTIRELVPKVAPEALRSLVVRTRGELLEAVKRVALDYQRNGVMPPVKPPCPPRDPLSGEYMERLLDPYANIEIMDAQGFRTSLIRPNLDNMTIVNPFMATALKAIGKVIRATHPASLCVAPWLEFVSRRTASDRAATGASARSSS